MSWQKQWMPVILQLVMVAFLVWGGIKILSLPGTTFALDSLKYLLPAAFSGLLFIINQYDLATLVALGCIIGTFIFVWFGIEESNSSKQANFFAVASFLFGFGTGMPIGGKLQTCKVSNGDGQDE